MPTTRMSIRIPAETKHWLERFTKGRGSGAGAAAMLLEEARRREIFPAVDFRDTAMGRLAYVQGTRVPVFFVEELSGEVSPADVSTHFSWPLWKAESVLAYAKSFPEEMASDAEAWKRSEDELPLRLPGMQQFPA